MKFRELTDNEFNNFAISHPLGNYIQTTEFKILREALGSKAYLVGVEESNNIIAASFIYEIPSILGKKIFYAPKGFLLDYNNSELLKYFTDEMIIFAKSRGGIKIIIDPEVIYQFRDNEGNSTSKSNDKVINNLKQIGYKHFGFNKNFETLQVRYQAVLPLKPTYEDTIDSFTKSTRNNILKTLNNGLSIRKAQNHDDIKIMYDLFNHTAENKHFKHRSLNYYLKLFDVLPDIINIYLVSIDFEKEKRILEQQLVDANSELSKIELEMKRVNIGSKMLKKKEEAENKIKKIENNLTKNEQNSIKYNKSVDIAALLSIKSYKEYCCITSGMLEEFKDYGPKYAMYNAHIKDAIDFGLERINFCGISGIFDHNNHLYKIFEIKKGFNGQVEEFIGEFSITFGFYGKIYDLLRKIKNK